MRKADLEKTYELFKDKLSDGEIRLCLQEITEQDPLQGYVPSYRFDITSLSGTKIGFCDLRIGHTEGLYYGGNIGYQVDEQYRGHHYAAKACKLLFPLARAHKLGYVIITCNPDNYASAKTASRAGCEFVEVVDLPKTNDMYKQGERQKLIYRILL